MKKILVIVLLVVVVAGLVGLKLLKSKPAETVVSNPEAVQSETATTTAPTTSEPVKHTAASSEATKPVATATTAPTTAETAANDTGVITEWEQKIEDTLGNSSEPEAAGKAILAMFPRLPQEGQIAAAQHIANLLPNEDFGGFASYLTNSATSSEVFDIIFADLLNRPNSIKLPSLLSVARSGKPEQASEAKDFLEVFIGEDYGSDWNLWSQKVQEWLKENPDDEPTGSTGTSVSN